MYTYHQLYTGSDLVADIGGYLGLFLGLSIFGLVGLLAKVFGQIEKKDSAGNENSENRKTSPLLKTKVCPDENSA